MIGIAALSLAYLQGVDFWRLALLVTVLYVPVLAIPIVLFAAHKGHSTVEDRAALFCETVSSELRSGRSLQGAVALASVAVGVSGSPPGEPVVTHWPALVEGLEREFPGLGSELRAIIDVSSRSGGAAAAVFDEVGSVAIAQAEIAREVRTASASARATAWLFILAPAAYITHQMRSDALAGAFHLPQQRIAAAMGLVLVLAGLTGVGLLIWRAR